MNNLSPPVLLDNQKIASGKQKKTVPLAADRDKVIEAKNIFDGEVEIPLLDSSKQLDISSRNKGLVSKQIFEKVKVKLEDFEFKEDLKKEFERRSYFDQARNLMECRTKWIYYECRGCGAVGWAKNHCGLRICPACAGRMKVRLLKKYEKGLKRLNGFYKHRLKLVTLTIENVPNLKMPGFDAISFIKQAFYRLRKRPCLRDRVYGGLYGVETTNKGKGWHVHIHALVSSEYILNACGKMKQAKNKDQEKEIERGYCSCCKKKCLRRLWQEETGQTIVDIRKANTKAVAEIIGYITKPFSTDDSKLLVDWWQAMKNRPFVKPFGVFYNMRKIKVRLACPWCGGYHFKVYYGDQIRLVDLRSIRDPPLGVDIENHQDILFIDPAKVIVRLNKRGFVEDRALYLQSNCELLVGSYK